MIHLLDVYTTERNLNIIGIYNFEKFIKATAKKLDKIDNALAIFLEKLSNEDHIKKFTNKLNFLNSKSLKDELVEQFDKKECNPSTTINYYIDSHCLADKAGFQNLKRMVELAKKRTPKKSAKLYAGNVFRLLEECQESFEINNQHDSHS